MKTYVCLRFLTVIGIHKYVYFILCKVQAEDEETVFRRDFKVAKSDYYLRHICPSALPSFRMNNLLSTGRIIIKLIMGF
jgi:hypothetical protein